MTLKEEAEANAFALELLIPKHFLLKWLQNNKDKKYSDKVLIERLCKDFQVTETTMKIRLLNLGILTSV